MLKGIKYVKDCRLTVDDFVADPDSVCWKSAVYVHMDEAIQKIMRMHFVGFSIVCFDEQQCTAWTI
jgi:hypothetical protein